MHRSILAHVVLTASDHEVLCQISPLIGTMPRQTLFYITTYLTVPYQTMWHHTSQDSPDIPIDLCVIAKCNIAETC